MRRRESASSHFLDRRISLQMWFPPAFTKRRLEPKAWIRSVMASWAPRPMDSIEITAATPITSPNKVREARSLLAVNDVTAVTKTA